MPRCAPRPRDPAGPVLLAIRPERVRLGAVGWAESRCTAWSCERAYAGETLTHTVRLADGSVMRATRSLRDGTGAPEAAIGDTVTLSWQPDACILLPP